jgi:hypothetical protein
MRKSDFEKKSPRFLIMMQKTGLVIMFTGIYLYNKKVAILNY